MLKQHLIFLVSSCEYLHRGLESLMSGSPARIIRVSRPEEIRAYPVSPADNRVVLVSLPSVLSAAVVGRVFLWRLGVLRSQGVIPGRLSCLLVGRRERWDDPAGGYDWLHSGDVQSVRKALLRVLECPECAERVRRPEQLTLPLSPRQQAILEGTLAKKRVSQIARELGVTDRAILASRRALMMKMGLRNRMELMGLAGPGV
ncbi:helix-turn-helix transcriptional regulator [Escherichia coli]|uniref:helix-turn-helix transcriptional regulator n=1 Tax=Escherichia coli TaxID=562 RepID=UPI0019183F0A|nr:LuxR C-terminal-related transcriptional regulator [Escherichia coli]CAD6107169.1 Bacterial regulatory proteins, luxR family [Escherichia coli]CAD6111256.1 Bacterial regulatory proteins, luxR family [Escherichia coli]CAD6181068.1 Bacterial regulatory proteins, luxR family [Escherichia coli]